MRPSRDYPAGIDVVVGHVVVSFDVVEVDGFSDPILTIQPLEIRLQVRVVHDASDVALEVAVVNSVESHECHKQSPIRFRDPVPHEVGPTRQPVFKTIERFEQLPYRPVIRTLGGGESRLR